MQLHDTSAHEGQKQQALVVPCYSSYIYRP